MQTHTDYRMSQLDELEAESIHIFREVAAEFEKPVLMFSGGKDSIVMLRLAEKAFYPAKIPFPVLQVDTGYDFPEVLSTRDRWVERLDVRLVVASVEEAIKSGVVVDDGRTNRNRVQIRHYLGRDEIDIPSIYFSHQRRVFERDGMLLTASEHNPLKAGETAAERTVRFRTVGDLTLTGAPRLAPA